MNKINTNLRMSSPVLSLMVLIVMISLVTAIPVTAQAHCGQCEEHAEHQNPFEKIAHELTNMAEDMEEIHHDMHKITFSLRLISFSAIGIFVVLLLNLLVSIFKK